jgi:molybdopterin molybdotransferase
MPDPTTPFSVLPLDEALAAVLARARASAPSWPRETVPLARAHGRRLAVPLDASGPWPTTDRSAMDGFGVRLPEGAEAAPEGASFPLVGQALAGRPYAGDPAAIAPGTAIRIMTGAVVPASIDAVVPVENSVGGYDADPLVLASSARRGDNIRRQGSEIDAGARLLDVGARIRSAEIGALAVEGIVEVEVAARPRVAILSTGDEVVPLGGPDPEPYQVRDSNGPALAALVAESGAVPIPLGIAADDPADLRARLQRGFDEADVVLTIGGISKGTADLVAAALADLGVERHFHGIQLKPGKPTWFGERGDAARKAFVFGLPGNPASCCTVFDLLVRPLLDALGGDPAAGGRWNARLAGTAPRGNRRLQALPASLRVAADGALEAVLEAARPSGDPFTLLRADGYALVPPGERPPQVGDLVAVAPCAAAAFGWPVRGAEA